MIHRRRTKDPLLIKSGDVLHSFFCRTDEAGRPGSQNMWFKAKQAVDIVQAELCGWGHIR
jgi:hypothetical protein